MKSLILKGFWVTCLISVLASPNLLAGTDGSWKKSDQDQWDRGSHREQGHDREDRDHRWENRWVDNHHNDHDRWEKGRHSRPERNYFDADDRRYLHDYYHHYDRHYWVSHNPPPGLFKHLKRHKHLPPDLRTYLVPFPVVIERHLCPLPPNYVRFMIGGKGLIVDAQFNVVDLFDLH